MLMGAGVPKDNKQAYIWYYMASIYTEKSKDDCSALIAERNRLKGTLTPDQLSETYAAFDLIRRKINQSKEAKKIAGRSIDKIANKLWRHGVKSACGVRIRGSAD